jgi:hypothetical protein
MTCACLHVSIRLQRRGLLHALQITIQRGNRMVQRPTLARTGSCEHHAHCRASGAHASQNDVGRSVLADPQGTLRDDSVEMCAEWHQQGFDAHHRHCERCLDPPSVILATARQRTSEAAPQRRLHLRRDVRTPTAAARRTAADKTHTRTRTLPQLATSTSRWRFLAATAPRPQGRRHMTNAPSSRWHCWQCGSGGVLAQTTSLSAFAASACAKCSTAAEACPPRAAPPQGAFV